MIEIPLPSTTLESTTCEPLSEFNTFYLADDVDVYVWETFNRLINRVNVLTEMVEQLQRKTEPLQRKTEPRRLWPS